MRPYPCDKETQKPDITGRVNEPERVWTGGRL